MYLPSSKFESIYVNAADNIYFDVNNFAYLALPGFAKFHFGDKHGLRLLNSQSVTDNSTLKQCSYTIKQINNDTKTSFFNQT